MNGNSLSRIAYGTINPMRFVQQAPGIIGGALQASGPTVPTLGIAWESVTGPQGAFGTPAQGYPAAASGQGFRMYGPVDMNTMVIVGSGYTVMPGNELVSDASGNAVPLDLTTTTVHWVGARAFEGGVEGNPIRVEIVQYPYVKN
jgi:hypothetical protein